MLFGSVSIALISFASYLYNTEQENLVRGERDALPLFCFVSYAAIEYMLKTLLTLLLHFYLQLVATLLLATLFRGLQLLLFKSDLCTTWARSETGEQANA